MLAELDYLIKFHVRFYFLRAAAMVISLGNIYSAGVRRLLRNTKYGRLMRINYSRNCSPLNVQQKSSRN